MNIKRRGFFKGCGVACVLLIPGAAYALKGENANQLLASEANSSIEKSIKASFGGGFSVQTHTQSNGLTYADIEHFGNRYSVASADLLDWKILNTL